MAVENPQYHSTEDYNINSHKSMPDLHSQISRHSPHSEILSSCSRGNRSNKSMGESSLNRDSGGSSGHYTHRSEPCYRQFNHETERDIYSTANNCCNTPMTHSSTQRGDYCRRDSGSSTQHSANSYCGYAAGAGCSYVRSSLDCAECRCNKNSSGTPPNYETADYLLNFTTPEVPEAFQDNYKPPKTTAQYKLEEGNRYAMSSSQQYLNSQQQCCGSGSSSGGRKLSISSLAQSPGSAPSLEEISPPPIEFKRQRCIRLKNRNRCSLPNSSAAMHGSVHTESMAGMSAAATYHRSEQSLFQQQHSQQNVASTSAAANTYFFPKCFNADSYRPQERSLPEINKIPMSNIHSTASNMASKRCSESAISDLERFFDRLGLNDEKFYEIYSQRRRQRDSDSDSTVFFSDVSTVDSMRLPDSTETQAQNNQQTYRPSEPPSIVERNARIIKWLCNIRKVQYA